MKKKRILGSILVGICLVLAIMAPYTVFATAVSDAQSINRYDDLAKKYMLLKAADACMSHTNNTSALTTADLSSDSSTAIEGRQKVDSLLSLYFSYTNSVVYSSYLEATAPNPAYTNSYGSDGKVYCSELGNIMYNSFKNFNAYNGSDITSLLCDSSLFKIYVGYSTPGNFGTANVGKNLKHGGDYSFPAGWTEPSGDSSQLDSSTCRANLSNIVSALESTDVYEAKDNKHFYVSIIPSKDFKASEWLSSKVGDINSINGKLTYATKLVNFRAVCPSTPLSREDYLDKIGKGISNVYAIYDNGSTQYLQLTSDVSNKKVYAGWEVSSSSSTTCGSLANDLSANGADAVEMLDAERETEIMNCYDSAQDVINNQIKKVQTHLERIQSLAETLITKAELVRDEETYNSTRFMADYSKTMENYSEQIGGGAAIDSFVAVTDQFEESILNYHTILKDVGSFTDAEREDLAAEIENYKSNFEVFKTDVVEKVAEIVGTIPEISTESMYIYGPMPEGQSHIYDRIDNFYSYDSDGTFTCMIVDDVLAGIIEEINGVTGGDIELSQYTPIDRTEPQTPSDTDAVSDPCYNAGIEGMSWILCPSLNNMVTVTDGISSILSDWLSVDSAFYKDSSKAHEAWYYFRDMANVAVIIVLLVIIVSQVTGYGIDNYGIKKMLPRLLVMAVLINVSFLLCQIAVDVSNILGSGLSTMFKSIGLTMYDGAGAEGFIGSLMTGIFAALGVAGAVGGIAITFATLASGSGGATLVVIFAVLLLVTALIAVVMFFLALGARLIVVIVFTAISPLALACYILPNTQGLFKKWWNVFKTALIIYPICGALYGMSFVIRAIIFEDGNGVHLWLAMIGIIAPFLPFLILPSLTKGALAGLGVLGGALATLGNGVKRGVSGARSSLENSEAFKQRMESGRRNMNARLAGLKVNRKTGELLKNADGSYQTKPLGKFGKFLAGGDAGIGRRMRQVQADQNTIAQENRFGYDENGALSAGFTAGMIAQERKIEAEGIADEEEKVMRRTNNGSSWEALKTLYRQYREAGDDKGMRAVARVAGRRKDYAQKFIDMYRGTLESKDENGKRVRIDTDLSAANTDSKLSNAVAKEIATGASSGMFRASSPLGYTFASNINEGNVEGSGKTANYDYDSWMTSGEAGDALDNFVTTSTELMGMKSGELSSLFKSIEEGKLSEETSKRIIDLANRTYANKDNAAFDYDTTKDDQIWALAHAEYKGGTDYNAKLVEKKAVSADAGSGDVLSIDHANPSESRPVDVATPVNNTSTGGNIGDTARPGSERKIILDPTGEEAKRAMAEFDEQQRGNRRWPGNQSSI